MFMSFGARLRRLREQRGMTQAQLARGIAARSLISMLESGVRLPTPELVASLARPLGVSPDALMADGSEDETRRNASRLLRSARAALDAGNSQLAAEQASEAAQVAAGIGDHPLLGQAHELTGDAQVRERQHQRAIPHYTNALDAYTVAGEVISRVSVLKALGNCNYFLHAYGAALDYYDRALRELGERGDDQNLWFQLQCNIATTNNRLGRWSAAAEHFQTALRLLENQGPGLRGRLLYSLGLAYQGMGDYETAEKVTQQAIDALSASGDAQERLSATHNLALIRCERSRWQDGFKLLRYCELEYRSRGDRVRLARILEEIGRYHVAHSAYDRAEAALHESRNLATAIGDRHQTAYATLRLSQVAALRGYQDLADEMRCHAVSLLALMGVPEEDGPLRQQA